MHAVIVAGAASRPNRCQRSASSRFARYRSRPGQSLRLPERRSGRWANLHEPHERRAHDRLQYRQRQGRRRSWICRVPPVFRPSRHITGLRVGGWPFDAVAIIDDDRSKHRRVGDIRFPMASRSRRKPIEGLRVDEPECRRRHRSEDEHETLDNRLGWRGREYALRLGVTLHPRRRSDEESVGGDRSGEASESSSGMSCPALTTRTASPSTSPADCSSCRAKATPHALVVDLRTMKIIQTLTVADVVRTSWHGMRRGDGFMSPPSQARADGLLAR